MFLTNRTLDDFLVKERTMMNRRLMMRHIHEVLRCHFVHGLSREATARSVGIAKGSVTNVLQRFAASGLTWPLDPAMSETELAARLYPPATDMASVPRPDLPTIERELRRPHVTLELLWREYHDVHPDGMSRASFYRYCRAQQAVAPTMKMAHKAGDKLFVDYSGDGLSFVNRQTGEVVSVALFVCCWGASSFCYADGTLTQQAPDFVASHERALRYFGGAPRATVPDNLKSGVRRSDRYEPAIGPLYAKLAEHYGFVVLPARVKKPQDKAVVENAVLNIQRYILGRLRDRTFFSLAEVNTAIRVLLDQFNDEPMPSYGGMSRRERFHALDLPAAQPLPAAPFRITTVQVDLRVARNYHIQFKKHHYSVPYHLVQQQVDVYLVGGIVEIYHEGQHIARHAHQPPNYGYSTREEHMPPHHRYVKGWSPEYFIGKGSLIGAQTAEVLRQILRRYKHPEQAYRSCLGVLNLAKHYTPERLEAAAARALHFQTPTYQTLKAILHQALDQQPLEGAAAPDQGQLPLLHDNVRGPAYYR